MSVSAASVRAMVEGAAWVLIGGAIVIGASVLWDGIGEPEPARQIARRGRMTTATASEVDLDVRTGLYVAQVKVQLADHAGAVLLSDIQPPETALDDLDDPPPTGWQPPSPLTG